jgi:Tol biopolymer transport system component
VSRGRADKPDVAPRALYSRAVPPTQLSHYRIVGPLGRGAMGEVYRAVDQRLGREVALKMLPREVEGAGDGQARLLREAQAVSALNHPGIVTLHDLATVDGRSFLVMELVDGEPCSTLARRGLPWARALAIVADAAEALAAAHRLGILHRDVKSDNLMVRTDGQVKVLDFGLAKLRADLAAPIGSPPSVAEPALADVSLAETLVPATASGAALSSDLTQAGHLVGTPAYMAPECYDGVATPASEVFALAVVAYELLTGRRPFDRGTAVATMAAIRLDEALPPSRVAPDRKIPAWVDAVILRALAKDPNVRFPDMPALAAALRASPPPPRRRWPGAVGAAALALAGGVGWYATRDRAEPPTMTVTASRRLTLDPGCEEYPRFSPDGRQVVYDGLVHDDYEILSVDLAGGAPQRITDRSGWDYAPALSPDGTRVAYVHEAPDQRVVMVQAVAGGPAVPLGPISGYPAWTEDGALLVGDPSGRIVRRELTAAGAIAREVELGRLPSGGRAYHVVAIAGAGVAVLWWTASDTEATALGELDLRGRLRIVEETLTDYEGGLAVAAEPRAYYVTRKGATTGNQLLWRRWGARAGVIVPGGLSPHAGIDVSRDGRRLVFSTCRERQYVARLRAGAAPAVLSRGEWQDMFPAPAGADAVVVTSSRTGVDQGWLIDLAGRPPRAVTPAGAVAVRASHDGALLAYAADGGRGGVAVVPLAGGAPRRLTDGPSDAVPTFTFDDREVVFSRIDPDGPAVYAVPVSGGPARRLFAGSHPATSPVAATIAALDAPDPNGARAIVLSEPTGAPRPLPGAPRAAWLAPRFSPDGTRLVAVRGFQEIVELTVDGSAPPRVVWTAATDSVLAVDWMPDGDGLLAALANYDGDLWLAEGRFR